MEFKVFQKELELQSRGWIPTFHDITKEVREIIAASGVQNGTCCVASHHTTCSVMVQEASHDLDSFDLEYLQHDLLDIMRKLIPDFAEEHQYRHPGPIHAQFGRYVDEPGNYTSMAEMNVALAEDKPLLTDVPFAFTDAGDTVGVFGRHRAGRAVLVNLAPLQPDRFSLLLTEVDMTDFTNGWNDEEILTAPYAPLGLIAMLFAAGQRLPRGSFSGEGRGGGMLPRAAHRAGFARRKRLRQNARLLVQKTAVFRFIGLPRLFSFVRGAQVTGLRGGYAGLKRQQVKSFSAQAFQCFHALGQPLVLRGLPLRLGPCVAQRRELGFGVIRARQQIDIGHAAVFRVGFRAGGFRMLRRVSITFSSSGF